jgi:hypothetical protein
MTVGSCYSADEGSAILAAEHAEALAWEASAVWNRYPAGHATENAAGSGSCVRSWSIPLQHDWRLLIAAN